MLSRVHSCTLWGIDAQLVQIEVQILSSLRRFSIVGLPDGVVREAKERVRCAVENSGFPFPNSEVIVNLAPADLPKAGSAFDLAIGAGILAALGIIPREALDRKILFGEMALDGSMKPVRGALAAACLAKQLGYAMITGPEAAAEARLVQGVEVRSIRSLAALAIGPALQEAGTSEEITSRSRLVLEHSSTFEDVIGQHQAKRALQIAAAGWHNVLMMGPPGSGKSMLAERLRCLLPEPSYEEQIEVLKVRSADTTESETRFFRSRWERPFRSPHHTVSTVGLVGGGSFPTPGEVSLAHCGVLFLDELPHVRRDALEALREPLETQRVVISRARQRLSFPADFMLVAAMNPCPCGKRGSGEGRCGCAPGQIRRYTERISGPVLDRIDLQIWVPPVPLTELAAGSSADPTPRMIEQVRAARERQHLRLKDGTRPNARLRPKELRLFCRLPRTAVLQLSEASKRFALSARGYARTLKVSRTIADLEGSESIQDEHVEEALSYRTTTV